MRKLILIFLILGFWISVIPSLHASSQVAEYLCEIGMQFYREGRYDEALHELKKALLAEPNYPPALRYIEMIKQAGVVEEEPPSEVLPFDFKPISPAKEVTPDETIDLIELQREMILKRKIEAAGKLTTSISGLPGPIGEGEMFAPVEGEKRNTPLKMFALDESFENIPLPIEIEKGKSILILGRNIQRFMITEPDMIEVRRGSPDELLVTGKNFGYSYLHIWDDNGRWTIEWLVVLPQPEGPSYEDLMRKEEEKARNFKLSYNLNWTSYETGRRLNSLRRTSYSWLHGLSLIGPTPYGNFDSYITVRRLKTSVDLTSLTIGLTDGQIGPFKDFDLRGFDFSPYFSNLAFPGTTLRGVLLDSPAFNKKINYSVFWGRDGGGRYGNLSPALSKIQHSFIEGFNIDYSPFEKQNYGFTLVHGWGRDREDYLMPYGYDLRANWDFEKWGVRYEISQDSKNFAQLLRSNYIGKNINLALELRDIDKSFYNIQSRGSRQGQLGGLFNVNYKPLDKLSLSGGLDVYRDRLFPNEEHENRWNEDLNLDASYQLDLDTSLSANYTLLNNLGMLFSSRYISSGLGISRRIRFIRDIYTYANYAHQISKNYSSPSSNYTSDHVYAGLRFSLIGQLYYYANFERYWAQETFTSSWARPFAYETGVDFSRQIFNTPFYGDLRFTYRNEEETDTSLSFLSGEDYIEGYSELSYQPNDDTEIYGSCRVRNVWADNPNVEKNMEADFNAGLRYTWDTKVHWDAVGNVEGYVFKDLNSDGLRQKNEPPIQDVKIWLGKNKSSVTDQFGYYKFLGVKAIKAYVNLDTSTLPPGYVLTVPVTQEVAIGNHQSSRVDFGIICRSEISGFVFEDLDSDNQFSSRDKGVEGVIISLEDGSKSTTNSSGKYYFPNAPSGEHALTIDLNSLPIYYLPQVPLSKEVTVLEGVTYVYNVPLKKTQK